jgi:hypothetical protein
LSLRGGPYFELHGGERGQSTCKSLILHRGSDKTQRTHLIAQKSSLNFLPFDISLLRSWQAALLWNERAEHERKRLEKLGQLPPPDPVLALVPKNDPAKSTESKPKLAATGAANETERQPSPSKGRALQGSLEATKKRIKAVTGAVTALNQAAKSGGESPDGRKDAVPGGALSEKARVGGSASQDPMTGGYVAAVEAKGVEDPMAGGHGAGATDVSKASATIRSTISLKKKPLTGAQIKVAAEAHQPQAATSQPKTQEATVPHSALMQQRTQSLGPEWEKAQKRAGSMEEPPEEKSSVDISTPGHSDAVGKLFKSASPKDPSGRADSVGIESVITEPRADQGIGRSSEGAFSVIPAEPTFPRRKQPSNGKRNGTAEAVPLGVKKGLASVLPTVIQHDNPAFSPANSPFATAGKASPFVVNVKAEESQTPAQNHGLAPNGLTPSQGPALTALVLSEGTSVSLSPGDQVPEQPKPTSRHVSTEDLFVTARDAVSAAERKLKEEPVGSPGREARQNEEGPVGTESTREKFSSLPSFKVQRTNADGGKLGSKVPSPSVSRRETSANEKGVIGKPGLARVDSRPDASQSRRTGGSAAKSAGADGTNPSDKERSSFSKSMSRGLSAKPALKPETEAERSDAGEATKPSHALGASPESQSPSSEITRAEPVMEKVGSGLKPLKIPNSRKSVTETGSNPGTPQSIPTAPAPVTDSAGNMPITTAPVPIIPVAASAGIGRRKSGDERSGIVVESALVQERERKMREELDLIVGGLAYLKTNQSPAGKLQSSKVEGLEQLEHLKFQAIVAKAMLGSL